MHVRPFNRRQVLRDFLSRSPLFSALAPAQLDQLCTAGRLLELPAKAALFQAGDPVREVFVLCDGSVLRYRLLTGDARKLVELVQSPQVLALGVPIRVQGFEERSMGEGADAAAVAIVEVAMDGVAGSCFGAGMHRNTVTASVRAIVSAANRIRVRRGDAAAATETADCAA